MSTTIYLVRHAEAEGNLGRRCHGHYDSMLTRRGLGAGGKLSASALPIPIWTRCIPVICGARDLPPWQSPARTS